MQHRILLCACLGLLACGDSSDAGDRLGQSDLRALGSIEYGDSTYAIDTDLAGNTCARLGWLVFRSRDGQSNLTFVPGTAGLAVGTFVMQWQDSDEPKGWFNGVPTSLRPIAGTTLITSSDAEEVRGAVDWQLGMQPDVDVPPDPLLGTVRVRGTFRAQRVGGESDCWGG